MVQTVFFKNFFEKLKIVFCEFESREPEIENEKIKKSSFLSYTCVCVRVKAKNLCVSQDVRCYKISNNAV